MNKFIRPEPRPLTQEDQTLLEWLIANGSPHGNQYVSQIAEVSLVGRCTCGCPTIDLALGGRKQKKTAPSEILADFVGRTPEGIEVGVVLHAREGEISELEVYAISDVKEPIQISKHRIPKAVLSPSMRRPIGVKAHFRFLVSVSLFPFSQAA